MSDNRESFCRGSFALGTACGKCPRCNLWLKENYNGFYQDEPTGINNYLRFKFLENTISDQQKKIDQLEADKQVLLEACKVQAKWNRTQFGDNAKFIMQAIAKVESRKE